MVRDDEAQKNSAVILVSMPGSVHCFVSRGERIARIEFVKAYMLASPRLWFTDAIEDFPK